MSGTFTNTTIMHIRPTIFWLTLSFLCCWSAQSYAGAWAQEDRGVYAKLSGAYASARTQFKNGGDEVQLLTDDLAGTFEARSIGFYIEYGLLPKWTLFGATTWMSVLLDSEEETVEVRGFGDLHLGVRHQFYDGPVVLAISSAIKTPTGYTPNPGFLKPSLGNGVVEWDNRILVGKSFWPVPVYFSAEAGFRYRGKRTPEGGGQPVDFSNEIPYALEIGYGLSLSKNGHHQLLLRGAVQGVYALGDLEALNALSLTPTAQHFTKLGPSIILTLFQHTQINVDYMYTALGANTVRAHEIFVGLAWDNTL